MFNNHIFSYLGQRCINLSNLFLKPFLNKINYQSASGYTKMQKPKGTLRKRKEKTDNNKTFLAKVTGLWLS